MRIEVIAPERFADAVVNCASVFWDFALNRLRWKRCLTNLVRPDDMLDERVLMWKINGVVNKMIEL